MAKTVLITGAAGGIAAEVNRVFAEAGWRLVLFGFRETNVARLREAYPDAFVFDVDLTDEGAVREAVARAEEQAGGLDAALNLAGGFGMQAAVDARAGEYEKMLALNLKSLFNVTRAVLPGMLRRGDGFLLGVSAAAGIEGGAKMGLYAASKAAVAAYLKSLHAEVGPQGVRVSILYPMDAVDTPGNRAAMPKTDPARWIDPVQIAEALLFLATRSRRGHVLELRIRSTARHKS